MPIDINELVFVGLNGRVAALDGATGRIVWNWKAPKPRSGYVSLLLLDERQLIASVNGYTYSLNPGTGQMHWYNELKGFGWGVTSIVAMGRQNPHDQLVAAAAADAAARNSSTAPGTAGTV